MTSLSPQRTQPTLRLVALTAGLLLSSLSAQAVTVGLISNSSWLSTADAQVGWQNPGSFDTSAWVAARAPYPTPAAGLPGSDAQTIWHDPSNLSVDGTGGVSEAWFRRTLDLNLADAGQHVSSATVRLRVDDDYAFYVNGLLALLNDDQGYADRVQMVDITSFLREGENLFAIHAVDGGWGNPYSRSYQGLLFDAQIEVVPAPASMALVLAALAAAGFARRKH